jgi:hypothetical protein
MAKASTWTDAAIDRQLGSLYYTTSDRASYEGIDRLHDRAQELGIPVDRERVRRFLSEQVTYTVHKPAQHKFRRNPTLVAHIDEQ